MLKMVRKLAQGWQPPWKGRESRRTISALLCAVALLLPGCGEREVGNAVFRVTVSIVVDGKVKHGSAIWQIIYFRGGDANWKPVISSRGKGVAAVLDLGTHGTLVVPRTPDFLEWKDRKARLHLSCPQPLNQTELFQSAIGATDTFVDRTAENVARNVEALKDRTVRLASNQLPAFVWFPAGKPYTDGQQLCPEEWSRSIGLPVTLQSVTVEAAPDAQVKMALDVHGKWLDTLRADKSASFTSRGRVFRPYIDEYEGGY